MYTRLQPILLVRDLAGEARFYERLGFTLAAHGPDFASASYGEQILFGLQRDAGAALGRDLVWQIGCTSVAAVARRCAAEGIELAEPLTEQPWGEWTMAVESPNGYRVIFEGPYGG